MKNRIQFLDGTVLKIIAMISMIFDHIGDAFFPEQTWMRIIGRIAMPVFAFCVAEGFAHTRDRKKYLLRMGIFALISEVPFDLFAKGDVNLVHQNIMFTFLWAMLGLTCYEKITENKKSAAKAAGIVLLLVFIIISAILRLDYNMTACGLVMIFYLLREKNMFLRTGAAALYHMVLRNVGIHWFGLLSFPFLLMYNGEKGKGLKWLFYVFYPGHMLAIWLIKILL
ncbi:MAG: conjugal transfer protein TraX [Solobacterium sp.]|nr:conjugal transfer protein TraX [Solobacterium sp.]